MENDLAILRFFSIFLDQVYGVTQMVNTTNPKTTKKHKNMGRNSITGTISQGNKIFEVHKITYIKTNKRLKRLEILWKILKRFFF